MKKLALAGLLLLSAAAFAQVPNQGGMGVPNSASGGSPSGAAGGLLSGTYPNPSLNLGQLTNSIGSNISLTASANYFDGPSVAQGSTGVWCAYGQVTVSDSSAQAFFAKLWDGTTVIDSSGVTTAAANAVGTIHLSGCLSAPAGNLKISVREPNATTGVMQSNVTGNSKDSSITVFRIQ